MAVYTVLNTEAVPTCERFGFWLETLARATSPCALSSEHQADFRAEAHTLDLGAVRTTLMTQPSMETVRTPKLIRQSDPEIYQFGVNVRGNVIVSQDRSLVTLTPGDMVLMDSSRPYHCVAMGGAGRCVGLTLVFPRILLSLPENKIKQLLMRRMSGRESVGRLLRQHLMELIKPDEMLRPADAARVATITLDLLTAMLAQQLEAGDLARGEASQRTLLLQINSFIHRNLNDPDLSPRMIATEHGISVRSLHRLFRDNESSVARWIRTCRLDRCRRDLVDPQFHSRPVHAIAARWGLTDPAHFSRIFRDVYGLSPHAYRQEHARQTRAEI